MKKLGYDNFLQFDAASHTYSDVLGNKDYVSVSGMLKKIAEQFDEVTISFNVAKSRVPKGSSYAVIKREQEVVLGEWYTKRDDSCVYGTDIHEKLENYFKTGRIEDSLRNLAESVAKFIGKVGSMLQEVRLYSFDHRISGTTDICCQRTARGNVWSFYDYKTCDIHFKSLTKDGKHLNKFLLEPVSHIEDCNFNKYSLQLSMYAYLAEITYGIVVGDLAILQISKDFKLTVIPCNYLRTDVMNIFAMRKTELEAKNPIYVDSVEVCDNEENNW